MDFEACVVLVTCGTLEEAETIAETVVREKVAACANVISPGQPVRSFYVWQDELQRDDEVLLIIKTRPTLLEYLQQRIQALHSYTVPEFMALPVLYASQAYMDWLKQNTTPDPPC